MASPGVLFWEGSPHGLFPFFLFLGLPALRWFHGLCLHRASGPGAGGWTRRIYKYYLLPAAGREGGREEGWRRRWECLWHRQGGTGWPLSPRTLRWWQVAPRAWGARGAAGLLLPSVPTFWDGFGDFGACGGAVPAPWSGVRLAGSQLGTGMCCPAGSPDCSCSRLFKKSQHPNRPR